MANSDFRTSRDNDEAQARRFVLSNWRSIHASVIMALALVLFAACHFVAAQAATKQRPSGGWRRVAAGGLSIGPKPFVPQTGRIQCVDNWCVIDPNHTPPCSYIRPVGNPFALPIQLSSFFQTRPTRPRPRSHGLPPTDYLLSHHLDHNAPTPSARLQCERRPRSSRCHTLEGWHTFQRYWHRRTCQSHWRQTTKLWQFWSADSGVHQSFQNHHPGRKNSSLRCRHPPVRQGPPGCYELRTPQEAPN